MKKHIFFTLTALILCAELFSQENPDKLLIGASAQLWNNQQISIYSPATDHSGNGFGGEIELGYFVSQKSLFGLELGYTLSKSKSEDKQTGDELSSYEQRGFRISPKYRFIENVSEKFKIYADVQVNLSATTEDHYNKYYAEDETIAGNYFSYGLSVDPGILYKFTNHFGVKLDCNLFYLTHQSLTQADDSDIDVEDQEGWFYGLNRDFGQWTLGAFFTF